MNLKLEKPLIIFDTETTGVNTVKDRIIQLYATKINVDGSKESKEILLDPTIPIPLEASEIHGIYDKDIEGKPTFKQVSKSMFSWFEGCDLGGYNSNSFDVNIIIEEFKRCGLEFDTNVGFVDVFNLYKQVFPSTLGGVYKTLTGKDLDGAHDAKNDVVATEEILEIILEKIGLNTVQEVDEFSQGEKKRFDLAGKFYKDEEGVVRWSFGKHVKEDVKETPKGYINWFLGLEDTPTDSKNKLTDYLYPKEKMVKPKEFKIEK